VKATHNVDQQFADMGAEAAIRMGRPERMTSITVEDLVAFAVANGAYYDELIDSDKPVRKLVVKFKGNGGQAAHTPHSLRKILTEARHRAIMRR